MTDVWKRIYKVNVVRALQGLADSEYQRDVWLDLNNPDRLVDCFSEAMCDLFDDCAIGHYLREGEVILDREVTQALWDLDVAVDAIELDRPEEDIVADPLMEVVREIAARALVLIEASTGEGSTVDIAIPGQSRPGEVVE